VRSFSESPFGKSACAVVMGRAWSRTFGYWGQSSRFFLYAFPAFSYWFENNV